MNNETIKILQLINNTFSSNDVKIKILKINHQDFKDVVTIELIDTLKSINKIKAIIKTITSILKVKIDYIFNFNLLDIIIYKTNNKIYKFEDYIFRDLHKNKGEILLGVDGAGRAIFEKIDSIKSLLISGSSGSGKSNLLHQLILSYLLLNDNGYLMLIDPKHTELSWYSKNELGNRLPLDVAFEFEDSKKVINAFNNLITSRYKKMKKKGERFSSESPILLVIDEYASLFTDSKQKRIINNLISRIASLGRAARCYLIITTQHPTNANLTNSIRVNLQSKLALHCESSNQSFNIINSREAISLNPKGEYLLKVDGKETIFGKSCLVTDELLYKTLKG